MAELPLVIDCQTCVARLTDACSDCLVTFLYDEPVDTPVILESSEARVLRLLTDEGLVPALKRRSA
jgi:hypothetical protein